jgi:uncharacterized protein involved in exopolysaccharide biosynthesis
MRPFVTETNPDYRRVEESLSSLRNELAKLENGRTNATDIDGAVNGQKGLANIKLLRDVKYYQMLYELLAKQYEVARLDEAKDPSVIQVLDPAVEPERRSKPKRAIIVLISAAAAFVLAICGALVLEVRERSLVGKK